MRRNTLFAAAAVVLAAAAVAPGIAGASPTDAGRMSPAAEAFSHTTRSTPWNLVRKVKLDFPTYHPQGLAQAGDRLLLSSVEITEPPVKYPEPRDGYDRSTGKGVGHVFVLTRDGKLLRDIVVGEGTMYHPGGIDYDGENVWVPVAEYRPDSRSVVYTIDPETFQVTERFRYADHVGGSCVTRRPVPCTASAGARARSSAGARRVGCCAPAPTRATTWTTRTATTAAISCSCAPASRRCRRRAEAATSSVVSR